MKKENSILGGIIILILGICLLWWNEGNNVKNIQTVNEGLKNYVDIKSDKIDSKYDGKLVATNGKLIVNGEVSDAEFNVSSNSAALYRKVEMYQWTEDCDADNNCTYNKEWKEELIDSSNFKEGGHSNLTVKLYESEKFTNNEVMLGAFILPDRLLNQLSTKHKINELSEEVATNHNLTITNNYYTNVIDNKPEVGNIRISFYDNNAKVVSVLAEQSDDTFKVYKTKKGKDLFRIYEDNYDGNDILQIISKQNNFMKWLWRLVGFILTTLGISSMFNPLTMLMNKIPILGGIVNTATGLVSFVLGAAISLIVIAIAWFRFRPILSIILIIIVVALILLLKWYSKDNAKQDKKEEPALEK